VDKKSKGRRGIKKKEVKRRRGEGDYTRSRVGDWPKTDPIRRKSLVLYSVSRNGRVN
jgi:hypothetical protein